MSFTLLLFLCLIIFLFGIEKVWFVGKAFLQKLLINILISMSIRKIIYPFREYLYRIMTSINYTSTVANSALTPWKTKKSKKSHVWRYRVTSRTNVGPYKRTEQTGLVQINFMFAALIKCDKRTFIVLLGVVNRLSARLQWWTGTQSGIKVFGKWEMWHRHV